MTRDLNRIFDMPHKNAVADLMLAYLRDIPLHSVHDRSFVYAEQYREGQHSFWAVTLVHGDGGASSEPIPTELEAWACVAIVAEHTGART